MSIMDMAAADGQYRALEASRNRDVPRLSASEKLRLSLDALNGQDITPSVMPSSADYEVKSWPAFFSAMITGQKKHDMRKKSDRDYLIGDRMLLREYDPFGCTANGREAGYTGREAIFEITYITSNDTPCAMSSNALDRDAVILSVALVSPVFMSGKASTAVQ